MFCLTLRIPSTGITSQCQASFEPGVGGLSASKFQSENELPGSKEIAKPVPQGSWVGSALHAVLLWPLLRMECSWSCQHWEDAWGQSVLHSQLSLGTSGQQLLCLKTSSIFSHRLYVFCILLLLLPHILTFPLLLSAASLAYVPLAILNVIFASNACS